jgi:small subunit ribosomal protein S20
MMPNIKSQKKRVITSEKDKMRNKAVRSKLRHHLKKANASIVESEDKEEIVSKAFKEIDTAARKGVIHKNNANRKKAAIARKAAQ